MWYSTSLDMCYGYDRIHLAAYGVLSVCEAVKDKEDQARKKTNDDEIAVENVDVDIEWREAECCGLKRTISISKRLCTTDLESPHNLNIIKVSFNCLLFRYHFLVYFFIMFH